MMEIQKFKKNSKFQFRSQNLGPKGPKTVSYAAMNISRTKNGISMKFSVCFLIMLVHTLN